LDLRLGDLRLEDLRFGELECEEDGVEARLGFEARRLFGDLDRLLGDFAPPSKLEMNCSIILFYTI
jgi:hypothetical protein